MVTTRSTDLNQRFGPIPTVSQDIELTRNWQCKGFNDLLSQGDFGLKATTTPCAFWVIKFGPQGQKEIFEEQGRENPLMAKDIGHVLGMILVPATARNLFPGLLNQAVIHDKKQDIPGCDPQCLEELTQGGLRNLLDRPDALAQKTGEAAERPAQERMGKGLHHGGSMDFFAQLDEADNKGREDFKRRS